MMSKKYGKNEYGDYLSSLIFQRILINLRFWIK